MLRPTSLRDQQREMICSMLRPQADKVCCPSSVHTLKRLEWEKCVLTQRECLRASCDRDMSVAKWAVVGLAMLRLVVHALANAAVVPVWIASPRVVPVLGCGEESVGVSVLLMCAVGCNGATWFRRVCVCVPVWTHRASITQ